MVEVEDEEGRKGFADAHISPGSSSETRDGGWQFSLARIDQILGMAAEDAKALILSRFVERKVATTALVAALAVLPDHHQLQIPDRKTGASGQRFAVCVHPGGPIHNKKK